MNRLRFNIVGVLAVIALCLSLARPAVAQSVTSSDIQRLQDQLYDVSNDVSRMRGSQDSSGRLQTQIDDLRDEVVYLKVKLRKEGSVSRSEYNDLQDRIQDVRSQARANAPGSATTDSGTWRTNTDPNETRPRPTADETPARGNAVQRKKPAAESCDRRRPRTSIGSCAAFRP